MVVIKGVLAQLARYLLVGGFAFLVDFGTRKLTLFREKKDCHDH